MAGDAWSSGESYERYMGRWSRPIAAQFIAWLDAPRGLDWIDVGCGTGALTQAVLREADPRTVLGVDPSDGFLARARGEVNEARARFEQGDAGALPAEDDSVDMAVSALAYNFFPDRPAALTEQRRVLRSGGTAGLYVWDYAGRGMGFIEAFWKAARERDPAAEQYDQASRFSFCTPGGLRGEFEAAGFEDVSTRALEIVTEFPDFEDFWQPFTLGTGAAPTYLGGLEPAVREALRDALFVGVGHERPIRFMARAWAVRGRAV